jgi:hypothetical protein
MVTCTLQMNILFVVEDLTNRQEGNMRVRWGREVWEIFYHFLGATAHSFP